MPKTFWVLGILGLGLWPGETRAEQWLGSRQATVKARAIEAGDAVTRPGVSCSYTANTLWVSPYGKYNWDKTYEMVGLVQMYLVTGERRWLHKLVQFADDALAVTDEACRRCDFHQLDLPNPPSKCSPTEPAWQQFAEKNPAGGNPIQVHYRWLGFTGAVYYPMLWFARLVKQSETQPAPNLANEIFAADGKKFREKAARYSQQFDRIFALHDPALWRQVGSSQDKGVYIFPNDLPISKADILTRPYLSRRGWTVAPLPNNMAAFVGLSLLESGRCHRLDGDSTGANLRVDRAADLARFQLSTMGTGTGPALWLYSEYMSRLDDIGHGNFPVQFLYEMAKAQTGIPRSALQRLSKTLALFLQSDGTLKTVEGPNPNLAYLPLIEGQSPFGDGFKPTGAPEGTLTYWSYAAPEATTKYRFLYYLDKATNLRFPDLAAALYRDKMGDLP